ncbi:pyridoxamine 5'-phosphate oxidase family protein [Gemmata sp. G18]|uniref:Pyridoxamine 5'-phosphate oxidase family protein n=1 Tax=Gemmata palustris TaxID=2822762 RepID=A0ABS5BTB8_9BACT|nr:pyridoxamine 5'-phosphate oxidase family protein [Gemmata palustris]MBP3956910.1 pyridoxamine 5'-phosphate oxidase family protein [Gemmata palustris]
MNSINENQPEQNKDDLQGKAAVAKIRELVGYAKNCFFCTTVPNGETGGTRPMNVRKVDDDGNLWFLSASDSHQNQELAHDPSVKLLFQGAPNSDFLSLTGRATVTTDRAKIEELWEPILKTWFTGGKDDPRITVIRVTPTDGYYWDTKHGSAVAYVKMLIGAAVGKTLDDSIEGKLKV